MPWFNLVRDEAEPKAATVQIFDQIGYDWWTDTGTEAKEFMQSVRELGELDTVMLELNSPGGNVHEGVSIANFIRNHSAEWTAKVMGEASSIASVIACACDKREMGVGTNFLVHKPLTALFKMANANDFRKLADTLDTIENSIVDFYLPLIEAKDKSREDLVALMEEDRYMTAKEALEWGFVDEIDADIPAVANSYNGKQMFEHASMKLMLEQANAEIKALKETPVTIEAVTDIEIADSDFSNIKAWVNQYGYELIDAQTEDPALIAKACQDAGIPSMTHQFIANKVSKKDFSNCLDSVSEIMVICDAANIDSSEVLSNFGKPEEMIRVAIQNAVAQAEPEQDPHVSSGKGGKTGGYKASTNKAYDQLNNRGQ